MKVREVTNEKSAELQKPIPSRPYIGISGNNSPWNPRHYDTNLTVETPWTACENLSHIESYKDDV